MPLIPWKKWPCRNPLKIRASLGREAVVWNSGENGRNPLKIRASLGLWAGMLKPYGGRNPLKIRASLGLERSRYD